MDELNKPEMTEKERAAAQRLLEALTSDITADATEDDEVVASPGVDEMEISAPHTEEFAEDDDEEEVEEAGGDHDKRRKKRRMEVSFASEEWLPGLFGPIRLRVSRSAVDLSRVRLGRMSFLADHDPTKPIGRITSARVGNDKVVYAKIEMAQTPTADKYQLEIDEGLRSGTSPGFIVQDVHILTEDDEEYDEKELFQVDITKWQPYEVSSTPIPRNPGVGIIAASMGEDSMMLSNGSVIISGAGRITAAIEAETRRRIEAQAALSVEPEAKRQEAEMSEETQTAIDDRIKAIEAKVTGQEERASTLQAELDKVRTENEVRRLGARHGASDLAEQTIEAGGDETDFRDKLLSLNYTDRPVSRATPPGAGEFSLSRLITAMMRPQDRDLQHAAAPELAAIHNHDMPATNGTFVIPMEYLGRPEGVQGPRFAITTSTADGTVDVMADVDRAAQFLMDRAPILSLCESITGLEGNVKIPVIGTDPTVAMVGESADPADRSGTFGTSKELTPHRSDGSIWFSTQSLIQTGGWLDTFLREQLGLAIAQNMASQILIGSGASNQVRGLNNVAGVNAVTYKEADKGKWESFVDMQEPVDDAKIPEIRRAYVLQNDLYHSGRSVSIDPGSGLMSIRGAGAWNLATGPMPAGMVGGDIPTYKTTLLGAGQGIYAEWTEVFCGIWRALEIITDTITRPGDVKLTAIAYFDMVVRRPKAVATVKQGS